MKLRRLAALLGAMALTFGMAGATLASAPTGHKVTICHGTNSDKNPYVIESSTSRRPDTCVVDTMAIRVPSGISTLKDQHIAWGDIIPSYDYGDFHFDGLNWTEAGQAIYNNGCAIPEEPVHTPAIHVEKTPSTDTLPDGGGDVTYTYVVTNTGDVPLSDVTVSDNKCDPVTFADGDTNDDGVLDLDESWSFTCTSTLTDTTTNTATATGDYGDTTVTDTDDATVTILPPQDAPSVSIDKTADPTTLPEGGGNVTYTYVVTNTGNVSIFDIVVTDDNGTPLVSGDDFTVICPSDSLEAGEHMTCTATVMGITVDTTNVATVNADWDSCHDDCSTALTPDTDDASVTVAEGGVQGETSIPTPPPTDAITTTTDAGGTLPLLLIVLGIIGLGAVVLTPARKRR